MYFNAGTGELMVILTGYVGTSFLNQNFLIKSNLSETLLLFQSLINVLLCSKL